MLTSLHIQNFKGFKDTLIPELRRVNLILGGQNVGKTSLLEAVVFVAGDINSNSSPGARSRLPEMFRPCEGEGDASRFWKSIVGTEKEPTNVYVNASFTIKPRNNHADEYIEFYSMAGYRPFWQQKNSKAIGLGLYGLGAVNWHSEAKNVFPASCPQGDKVPHPFPAFPKKSVEHVELYGRLVTGKKKKQIVRLLKQIEPRLDSIDAVAPDGEHRIYVELSDGDVLRPLSQLGHGFTRLFELYAGLAVTESKLALIDEIENGIHYSALPTLFQGVRELAESNDVQSLITTHSLECIKSAYEVFQDKLEDFQLIRLERTEDGNVRAIAINDENLKTIMESGWEIR
jgi:hypothetical protein